MYFKLYLFVLFYLTCSRTNKADLNSLCVGENERNEDKSKEILTILGTFGQFIFVYIF